MDIQSITYFQEVPMIKKLTRHGNSMALVIDRPVLELLHISEDTPLDISTDGESLLISPVKDSKRDKRFKEVVLKANQKYSRMLQNLAK